MEIHELDDKTLTVHHSGSLDAIFCLVDSRVSVAKLNEINRSFGFIMVTHTALLIFPSATIFPNDYINFQNFMIKVPKTVLCEISCASLHGITCLHFFTVKSKHHIF